MNPQPPSENLSSSKRRQRWWVRFVHPLRWGFWLVLLPGLAVSAVGSLLFGPWPVFNYSVKLAGNVQLEMGHRGDKNGYLVVGPFIIRRSPCSYGRGMRRGWLKITDERTKVTCWQYGWGQGSPKDDTCVRDGLAVIWRG